MYKMTVERLFKEAVAPPPKLRIVSYILENCPKARMCCDVIDSSDHTRDAPREPLGPLTARAGRTLHPTEWMLKDGRVRGHLHLHAHVSGSGAAGGFGRRMSRDHVSVSVAGEQPQQRAE